MKNTMNVIPGNNRAVKMVVNFQRHSVSMEIQIFETLAATFPAMATMNMKIKMTDCGKPPRCAGERNPSSAKNRVTMAFPSVWTHEPW